MKTKPITKEGVRAQVEFFKRAAIQPAPTTTEAKAMTEAEKEKQSRINQALCMGMAFRDLSRSVGMFTKEESVANIMQLIEQHDYCRKVYSRYVEEFDVKLAKDGLPRIKAQIENYIRFVEAL